MLHLSWILSKHGPHWPGSPTQIIQESTTPPSAHTQTHTLSTLESKLRSDTWTHTQKHVRVKHTFKRPNTLTIARRGTTGLVCLKHIRDSLKRHKECQNHINILLMSFPVIKGIMPYTHFTYCQVSHIEVKNINLKKTPWKLIVTTKS